MFEIGEVPVKSFLATVETKVKWSTLAAFGASLLLALLNAVLGNSKLLGGTPGWLQFVIVAVAPTVATALSGYAAPHSSIPPVTLPPQSGPSGKHTATS